MPKRSDDIDNNEANGSKALQGSPVGETGSTNERNIYHRINDVMKAISYIQKDASVGGFGNGYKAVSHDNVISQVRPHLIENGIVITPSQVTGKLGEQGTKWDRQAQQVIPSSMRMYEASYKVKFVNIDCPSDFVECVIESHALDNGDKGSGKALSYAVKYAILKLFAIETGENEESRTYDPAAFTPHQKEEFDEIIESKNGLNLLVFQHTVGPDVFTSLYNSFEKGHKVSGKKNCDQLTQEGVDSISDYVSTIKRQIDSQDPAVSELVDELGAVERKLVAAQLSQSEVEYLRQI